jgi:Ca-activated chloride channel family protein
MLCFAHASNKRLSMFRRFSSGAQGIHPFRDNIIEGVGVLSRDGPGWAFATGVAIRQGRETAGEIAMKIQDNMRGQVPNVADPTPFADPASGRRGWKVSVPGGLPLATPAVANGRVFLGGGFGSYDFWAFDAESGRLAWHYQTEDDGPTAAVVVEDRVIFNTESCELEVLTQEGRRVWKHWLGDPLMSMPAADAGRVYMACPDSRGNHEHYLACFDLGDGRQIWRQRIAGEIITCPVLAEGEVYLSNLDGTLACFAQDDGRPRWQEDRKATSAPAVWQQQCYFSQRHERHDRAAATAQQMEWMARKMAGAGTPTEHYPDTAAMADYLDHEKRRQRSPHFAKQAAFDAGVGFAGSKGDAKMYQAMGHLGHSHVSALWAYQGSKPFLGRGRLFSGQGDTVQCADPGSQQVFWKRKLRDSDEELLDSMLTPPAVVNGKLFLGTIDGRLLCLSADSGEMLWAVPVGEPILFQPAVVAGRVYAGTAAGSLLCLETGDPDDDGWHMWGATAAHNGLAEEVMAV